MMLNTPILGRSIFVALLFGALANISTGALTPIASMSKDPFIERYVTFSIASLPPIAFTYLSRTASTVGSADGFTSALAASAFGASVFGFSCAAVVKAASMAKARVSVIRFIGVSISELDVSVCRLVEFRVVNLDVIFNLCNFCDHGHRRGDPLHRVGDFDAVHNLVVLQVDFHRELPLRAIGLSIVANEQPGVDVEVELFRTSFGGSGFDH